MNFWKTDIIDLESLGILKNKQGASFPCLFLWEIIGDCLYHVVGVSWKNIPCIANLHFM